MELLKKENHPCLRLSILASSEYPVVDIAIVAHEKSMELAAASAMELKGKGIEIRLSLLRRISEDLAIGSGAMRPILCPSCWRAPIPARCLRGRTDKTRNGGKDKAYIKAAGLEGLLFLDGAENRWICGRQDMWRLSARLWRC